MCNQEPHLLLDDGQASDQPPPEAGLQHLLEHLSKHGHLKVALLGVAFIVVQQSLKGKHINAKLGSLVDEVFIGPQCQQDLQQIIP